MSSFWENNKGAIKSGSVAVLKGAGKATVTVSKAGYGAYKNHSNNKKTADGTSTGEEEPAPVGTIQYHDPKLYPPPPKHVAAYGTSNSTVIPNSQMTQQHPPQQQPVLNNSYPSAGQTTPSNMLNYSNPYYAQQPPQQSLQPELNKPPAIPQRSLPALPPQTAVPNRPLYAVQPDPLVSSYTSMDETYSASQRSVPAPPTQLAADYPPSAAATLPTSNSSSSVERPCATLPHNPSEEVVSEPKFKTNLMDFDISKFGAPPPKARLTKEEELKHERRKAEAQRLKQIKEQSIQKAKEASTKQALAFQTGNGQSHINSSESLPPVPPPAYSEVSPPPVSEASPSQTDTEPVKTFELPDISRIQPPPPPVNRTAEKMFPSRATKPVPPSRNPSTTSSIVSPISRQTTSVSVASSIPPPPPRDKTPVPAPPKAVYDRPFHPLPAEAGVEAVAVAVAAETDFVPSKPKKTPPPKPVKPVKPALLSVKPVKPVKPSSLSSDNVSSKPLKPVKPAKLSDRSSSTVSESSAKGDHIRELQARLGNLNLHQ